MFFFYVYACTYMCMKKNSKHTKLKYSTMKQYGKNEVSWLKSDKRIELKKTNLALKSLKSSACFLFLIKEITIKTKICKNVHFCLLNFHRVGHKKFEPKRAKK